MTYDEMLQQATEAIVKTQHEEMMAFTRGEVPADQWRPEKYAAAALDAVGISAEFPRTVPSLMPSPR